MRTLVIAETGCTHEGDLKSLEALVDVAARCGCGALKAQWTSDPGALCERRGAHDYRPYYEWLRFPAPWHATLAARCSARGLQYSCTVYLPEDVAVIDPYVSFYKVAAFEAEADDLLAAYARLMQDNQKELYISLAMGADVPQETDRRYFLRCVSAYPTPSEQLNLGTIREHGFVGLSDHTRPENLLTGALAVAAGARIVERHIRLETCKPNNPDFAVAMSEHGLAQYVENIREAEAAMGVDRGLQPAEVPMAAYRARRKRRKADDTEEDGDAA